MELNLTNKFEEYINQEYISDNFFENFSINASEVLKELKKSLMIMNLSYGNSHIKKIYFQ